MRSAVGRLLLSLDPLRDPSGILLSLDYYALASRRENDLDFVIELVRSELKVFHENFDGSCTSCNIICMPNWAYSYALALFWKSRMLDDSDASSNTYSKACQALRDAISAYPFMPELLLQKNNVDIQSRSFQMDWKPIVAYMKELNAPRKNELSVSKISSIFIDRSYQLWSGDDVLKWLYEACTEVSNRSTGDNVTIESNSIKALRRYEAFDPIDFSNSFRQIPQDLNPLDPGLADVSFVTYIYRMHYCFIFRISNEIIYDF